MAVCAEGVEARDWSNSMYDWMFIIYIFVIFQLRNRKLLAFPQNNHIIFYRYDKKWNRKTILKNRPFLPLKHRLSNIVDRIWLPESWRWISYKWFQQQFKPPVKQRKKIFLFYLQSHFLSAPSKALPLLPQWNYDGKNFKFPLKSCGINWVIEKCRHWSVLHSFLRCTSVTIVQFVRRVFPPACQGKSLA